MLAIAALSHGWQAALYGLALVAFLISAFDGETRIARLNLTAAGLALITFVWFWTQLAAT